MKEKSHRFQLAESCMYNYLENVARAKALRDELKIADMETSVRGQRYGERIAPNGYVDNVPARILKIDMLESLILGLERWTKPIGRLIADLESPYNLSPERQDMLGILCIRYLHGNTWGRTISYLRMSHGTFGIRRRQLVFLAAKYLGLNGLD